MRAAAAALAAAALLGVGSLAGADDSPPPSEARVASLERQLADLQVRVRCLELGDRRPHPGKPDPCRRGHGERR